MRACFVSTVAKLAGYTVELAEEVVTSGCLSEIVETAKIENVSDHIHDINLSACIVSMLAIFFL